METSILEQSIPQILNKLDEIVNRMNIIEKTYVSMNADLINQNIRMSEIIHGKLKEPDSPTNNNQCNNQSNNQNNSQNNGQCNESSNSSNSNNTENKEEKELFYYESNNKIIVYGPGTYDNRPILRQFGEWNSANKTWDLVTTVENLIEKLPNIIQKEKYSFINE